MILEKKNKKKHPHKKLLRLKTNPLNNSKFLQITVEEKEKLYTKKITNRYTKETNIIQRTYTKRHFVEIEKKKKKKWETFLKILVKANDFYQKYKPYTFQSISKFASQGNSFKKQFKKNLFTKKIFNIYYGGLKKKPLKKQMTKIYKSFRYKNNTNNICLETFESRLESVLKKTNFCSTIKEAKQIIK